MPRLVEFAQTATGRVLVLLVFLASLSVQIRGRLLFDTAVVLVLITVFSAHRRKILLFAALFWALLHVQFPWALLGFLNQAIVPPIQAPDVRVFVPTIIASVLLFCSLAHRFARSHPSSILARQPVWSLVALYSLLVIGLSMAPLRGALWLDLWAFVLVLGHYQWYLAYSLIDLRKKPDRGFSGQLGLYHPFWGGTNTPFPKGADYVDQIEAKTDEDLAVSQLKGIKLLWWSILLMVIEVVVRGVFYGELTILTALIPFELPIPQLTQAFRASVAGTPLPWHLNWAAMLLDLAVDGISLAIWGHRYIAIARMAGFSARRNTYKPFLATSVSDFFNRYYYYFKELLVDCFFYPIFYALFRKRFKVGLFLATMTAAGFGNYLYHFFRDIRFTVQRGLWQALIDSHMLLVYCLLLAASIFVSQVRRMGRKDRRRSRMGVVRSVLLVWVAFALLNSLIVELWASNLAEHVLFLLDSLPLPASQG